MFDNLCFVQNKLFEKYGVEMSYEHLNVHMVK